MVTLEEIISYFTNPTAIGYTPEKTLIFALLLVVAVSIIFEMLKKFKIKVDQKLAISVLPYVLLGATIRGLRDAENIFISDLFVTPGIYVVTFSIAFIGLLVALVIKRKFDIPYFKTFFIIGLFSFAVLLPFINFVNLQGFLLVSLFYLPWIIILYKIKWNTSNKLVTAAQMFDATATYVALQYFGYYEQHVVPSIFINIFSPISFIFLKVVGIVTILLLLDRFKGDKEFNNYLKLIIGILGLGTGTRDFLRLLALV